MASSKVRLLLLVGLIAAFVGVRDYSPTRMAEAQAAQFCYAAADGGDALWRVERSNGASTRIGALGGGFTNVEAISLNLDATVLYAAHDNGANGIFGTINVSTGAFTSIGAIGPASGVNRTNGQAVTAPMADVDSLFMHPLTGEMWGITHDNQANKIFRINTTTGHVIPDTFGPGLDYVEILLPHPPNDVDDLAIDPASGRFYIIGNSSGIDDELFELNINGINPPASPGLNSTFGTLSVDLIGELVDTGSGSNIIDMEGFSFFNDGTFYGVTGDQSTGTLSNRLWQINVQTGQAFSVTPGEIDSDGVAPYNDDFEAVACLTAGSNFKSGFVFEDFNGNGAFDGSDVRLPGVAVSFYRDNGNGSFDGGDTRVETRITDGNGQYTFEVAAEGLYFAVLDQATLPAGSTLTTVGSFNVNFVDFDNSLTNNNFGFTTTVRETATPMPTATIPRFQETPTAVITQTPPPASTPSDPSDPGIIKVAQPYSVIPGEMVTFTITVTNGNQTALTGVVVSDTLDGTFFSAVVEASATKGTVTTDGLTVTVNIGDLAPSESVVITIRSRVRSDLVGPKQTTNVALLRSNERPPLSSSATVILMTLPSTGYPPVQQSVSPGLWAVILGVAVVAAAWWTRSRRRV